MASQGEQRQSRVCGLGLASLNNSRVLRYRADSICLGPGPGDSGWYEPHKGADGGDTLWKVGLHQKGLLPGALFAVSRNGLAL